MKFSAKILTFNLVLITILIGCVYRPCIKNYAFEFPVTVTPKDTFVVGDTIWYSMDLSNQVLDHASGAYVDLTDFELFFSFSINDMDTNLVIDGHADTHLFDYVVDVGRVEQRQNTFLYTYFLTESIQDKRFRIGWVPTQTGTFSSSLGYHTYYWEKELDPRDPLLIADPDCRESLTETSDIIVNNKAMNYHMAEGRCRYTVEGERRCSVPEEELSNYGEYCFHVKEP